MKIKKVLNKKINMLSCGKSQRYYGSFTELRNKIYIKPEKDWDAQKICCDFCLSYGRFRITYKNIFGTSFHQDVISARIFLAKYLLITTKMNISAIAARCGYDDDKHFMHQFKQIMGITPNMYRKTQYAAD